jgi:hypothetical protein
MSKQEQITLDTEQIRLLRYLLPTVADEDETTIGLGEMRDVLRSCRTPHCLERGVFRYTYTSNAGLVSEKDDRVHFCDECWEGGICENSNWKLCGKCHQVLTPALDEDVSSCVAEIDPVTPGDVARKLVPYRQLHPDRIPGCEPTDCLIYHRSCGTLCNVCARFVIGKDGVSAVEGLTPDQHLCIECRGGQDDDNLFLYRNGPIVSRAHTKEGLRRFIRPVYPGPRAEGTVRGNEIAIRYDARVRREEAEKAAEKLSKKRAATKPDKSAKVAKSDN